MAPSRRSIHPNIAGTPWWAAVIIAMTAIAVGFAFDAGSGNKELTHVFAGAYVMGCVLAVLAVRQSAVFTAVIQPPLLLFCAVPGAYWLFHGAKGSSLKDTLINCGYPLIERFPLMLFTSAGVLLLGVIRWHLGRTSRARTAAEITEGKGRSAGKPDGRRGSIDATAGEDSDRTAASEPKARRRADAVSRAPKTAKAARSGRPARRSASSSERHSRPRLDDTAEATGERTRRRRPRPIRDVDADAEPLRKSRSSREPDLRSQPPREFRRDPHVRNGRPTAPSSRFDPYEPVEPYDLPPRRRPASDAANRASSTHHPISQVRYRGARRPRGSQTPAAESWEYDI